MDLERLQVSALCHVDLATERVGDAVEGQSEAQRPLELTIAALLDRSRRPLERALGIDSEQPEPSAQRGKAQLTTGPDLLGDPVRLAPFVVRALDLAEHPGRKSDGDQRPGPARAGRQTLTRCEECLGVLARADVLAADVPVHPQVAAQLHSSFAGGCVTAPRSGEERVERRLEVALLGDTAFDGSDLVGSLDAVADLACDLGIAACVSPRDLARLAGELEPLAGELADRLQHPQPAAPPVDLHERLVDERLELVETALARVCADRFDVGHRAPAGEDGHPPERGAAPARSAASGSSRSWRAASAAARSVDADRT